MEVIRHERTIEGVTHRNRLDYKRILVIKDGAVSINVANIEYIKLANAAPVTVTSITGGQPGQTIRILGDGQTSIQQNATIERRAGATGAALIARKTYTFSWFESPNGTDTFWSEDV